MSVDIISELRRVLEIESNALRDLLPRIRGSYAEAVEQILSCQGKVVVIGVGKCAHVAAKIASTLASTGTPAVFLHPGEAIHGDLGFVADTDIALVLSNSGETPEIKAILPYLQRRQFRIIAMTSQDTSTLANAAHYVLDVSVREEGDPLNMAPMASTTAMLALGDAIAAVLMKLRNFVAEDYAHLHPGGSLGQKLLCTVDELMHTGDDIPLTQETDSLLDAIYIISTKRLGCTFVLNSDGLLTGIVTDGDLRRAMEHFEKPREVTVEECMTRTPRCVPPGILAVEALNVMEQDSPVTVMPVVGADRRPVGALHIHDLIRAGIA